MGSAQCPNKKSEKEEEEAHVSSMQMLSALQFMSMASSQGSEQQGIKLR